MPQYIKIESSAFFYRVFSNAIDALIFAFILFLIFGLIPIIVTFASGVSIWQYELIAFGIVFLIRALWGVFIAFLEYKNLGYAISTHAINFRVGAFSINQLSVPYSRITNVSFYQSLTQRLFSVGDITIDQEDSEIKIDKIDKETATKILQDISSKSNIQPIYSSKKIEGKK